jgi:hypothetical protein
MTNEISLRMTGQGVEATAWTGELGVVIGTFTPRSDDWAAVIAYFKVAYPAYKSWKIGVV